MIERGGVRVRGASEADLDRIVEIASACFTNPWTRESFASDLARSWTRILVAESPETGRVDAFVHYWLVATEVQIMNVATDPTARRRGLARALVDAMMTQARALGSEQVVLEVRASNVPAIELYASFGFERTGTRERYYDDGEDAVLMAMDPCRAAS